MRGYIPLLRGLVGLMLIDEQEFPKGDGYGSVAYA